MARAILIHFVMHWPQAPSTDLWSFAVDQAIYIWNHPSDSDTKLSPIEFLHRQSFIIFTIFIIYISLVVESICSILPCKMQRSCLSGIDVVDELFILVTVANIQITVIWFSISIQGRFLHSYIWSLMTSFQQSTQTASSMLMSGTHLQLLILNYMMMFLQQRLLPLTSLIQTQREGDYHPGHSTTDPITNLLSFINNLPSSSEFPSLPADIDDHLPSSNDGPTASF
jgi:hypothetical protein